MSNIQICPHPLTTEREEYSIGCGLTVREMLREVKHEWVLDSRAYITLESENHVEVVTDFDIVPAPGETLAVNVIPQGGGGGGGKNPLGTILSIAVIAASTYFAPEFGVALYNSGVVTSSIGNALLAGKIVAGAISIAAMAGVSAISGGLQKPSVSGITQNSQTSSIYTITGTQNSLNKYGPIPTMVGGTTRIWPTLAAEPYTEVVGEDQYLRQRFAITGPVELSDFKIGETALSEYEDVELEWIQGFAGDTIPTLYADGQDISETAVNITLLQVDDWATRTTQTQTKEIIYDIAQNQLFKVEGSAYVSTSVVYEVSYRETDTTGDWLAPDLGKGSTVAVVDGDATSVTISGYYTNSRLFPYRFTVPEGQYDVRWRRITTDHEDDTEIFDDMAVAVLRSIANHPGIDTDRLPPMAIIDLRIKASGQLNGVVDQLNCLSSAYLPVYDGISAVNYELSDNPAWAYFNVLYGLANKNRITDLTRYDLDGLVEWAELCTAQGWAINGILDTSTTTYKMLQTIATIGRSSLSMINNKYGVATDWEKDAVVQVFTPRNSWGFESTKAWPDEIHAIRAQFVDETSGYEQGERKIYVDGYTESTATKFLDQEIQYITDPDQVWKHYRYQLADRTLRPEIYSFSVDVENLRCTRGDRIRVVHDVMSVGLGQARIKFVTTDESGNVEAATIDSLWTLDTTTTYAYNLQRFNGQVYEGFLANPIALDEYNAITFNPAIPAAVAPSGGELIAFGEADKGVGLDAIIHEIIPGANLTAKIVCQDYAPGIQSAADGVIPPYDAKITVGRNPRLGRPDQSIIESIVSDENVLIREADGSLTTRTILSVLTPKSPVPLTSLSCQYKRSGNELWETVGVYQPDTTIIEILNLVDGEEYDFRVQTLTDMGSTSGWHTVYNYTVIGKTSPPPAVDAIAYSEGSLFWSYSNKPIDHRGYLVRFSTRLDSNWDNATPAHDGILPTAQLQLDHYSGNGLLFLVKAVDIVGLESTTPQKINPQLGSVSPENILATTDYDPEFPGNITGGVVSGGDIIANAPTLFWNDDSAIFWGVDSDMYWPDQIYTKLTYDFVYNVPSEYVGERILIDSTYVGDAAFFFRKLDTSSSFWGSDSDIFWGSDSSLYWHKAEDVPEWLPWPGSVDGLEEAPYHFKIEIPRGETRGVIDEVAIVVDADTIVETFDDVVISSSGTRVPLTLITHSVKNIQGTPQGVGTGTSVTWEDKNVALGPLIKVLDDSGTAVDGVVDLSIGGY